MIYRMLVLITCCWGSNLSIQAEGGKLNGDLLQPSGIRYEVWSFSVRHLISIVYWKWLISGVKLSVVVPQAIGISLRNRIGDSAGDVPYFYLGVCEHNGLDIIDLLFVSPCFCVAFYSMFVHWNNPLLVWPWPTFYHFLLCIHGFLAKSHVHMQLFFKQSRTSSLLVNLMLWEVAGSSLGPMSSVGCFFCDQRPHFHWFFFKSSFSHFSFLFCH